MSLVQWVSVLYPWADIRTGSHTNGGGHVRLKVAAVSFLNTVPLVEGLVAHCGAEVALSWDLPSNLADKLYSGAADVALLPVAEILRGGTGGILAAGGIACRGAVDSVKLFASQDLYTLKRVAVDRGSRSSTALLRVLLSEHNGTMPVLTETEPRVGVLPQRDEGILIIGDRCFEYEQGLRESGRDDVRSWDLGQLWWDLTGLPFVFAVWAVAPDFLARRGPGGVRQLKSVLSGALAYGLENLSDFAAREAALGRLGRQGYATTAAIDYYFHQSLHFQIGDQELTGIRRFRELATRNGVISEGPMPPIL